MPGHPHSALLLCKPCLRPSLPGESSALVICARQGDLRCISWGVARPSSTVYGDDEACALQRGYDGELLGGTFSRAVFVGNGLIAIVAGLVAHTLVETLGMGPVVPFDTAVLVMVCGGVIVLFTWTENFGNSSEKKSFLEQLRSGAHAIANGESHGSGY